MAQRLGQFQLCCSRLLALMRVWANLSPGQGRSRHCPSTDVTRLCRVPIKNAALWIFVGVNRLLWGALWLPCFPYTEQVPITACQEVRKESRTRFTTPDTSSANTLCTCAVSLGGLSQFLTRHKTFYNEIIRWPYKSKASYPAPRN